MARSDLLISLVKAGVSGDQTAFRKTVESLIAEKRAKRHEILANRLADQLDRDGSPRLSEPKVTTDASVDDLVYELVPKRSFDDLILPKNVRDACHDLVEEHSRADLLRSHNLVPRNRVLLAGAPGNGKTSLAEALANALMVPFIVVRYDGLIASYLGETASRLRKLFDYVHTRQCVLFFDEFDTIGKERGDIHETGEIKRVVSSLLLQVDDLPPYVVVVTATNHPELLDRAVWRRFQLRLELPPPTPSQAQQFFESAAKTLDVSLSLKPQTLAAKLAGLSYSELEDFIAHIARRYVLSLPDADPKQIVQGAFREWQTQFSLKHGQ